MSQHCDLVVSSCMYVEQEFFNAHIGNGGIIYIQGVFAKSHL